MSVNEQESEVSFNGLRWLITFLALGGAVYANHYLIDESLLVRVAVILALVAVGFAIALTTSKGKAGIIFAKESRIEARKVVWPTRAETVQTSMIILVAVVLVSIMLYLIDMGLVFLISFLTVSGS
ncbi:MAG: preprotein translocase subunit SecE [Enterobacterales bacterium]|nr:preprotein translocase subunit SecE [Enterobacterales bacterium]